MWHFKSADISVQQIQEELNTVTLDPENSSFIYLPQIDFGFLFGKRLKCFIQHTFTHNFLFLSDKDIMYNHERISPWFYWTSSYCTIYFLGNLVFNVFLQIIMNSIIHLYFLIRPWWFLQCFVHKPLLAGRSFHCWPWELLHRAGQGLVCTAYPCFFLLGYYLTVLHLPSIQKILEGKGSFHLFHYVLKHARTVGKFSLKTLLLSTGLPRSLFRRLNWMNVFVE